MRIVLASGIYPPDIGGPATYSKLISEELKKRGHNVSVICYSDKKHKDSVVRILRKHNILIRYWFYFWNLLKIAKDTDVIYAQGPLAVGSPAMVVSRILRKRFIIKIVGDYAWEQGVNRFGVKDLIEKFSAQGGPASGGQRKKYPWQVELIKIIQRLVVKSADKVIVPSKFLKEIVEGWGVDRNKIEVIYNAFSRPEKIKHMESNGDIIITAGRPEPWKGFDTLRAIMPELKKENPKFKLVVATKMPHDELMGYFKASRMFVLNSGYEGFSHIILEAMACGLPVITTNVCGNPEIIKNGYNGLLIEYNNKKQLKEAILKLWRDKKLQKKFIRNGKKILERFKLEMMIKKTLKILGS